MPTYLGFSTVNRRRKFRVTDFNLVKQDLYNHFHIRRGEKLMNPDFGTIIWDMLFEPFTQTIRDAIADDVNRIASYDPRIQVSDIIITEFETGIMLEINVNYVLTNQVSVMTVQFDRELGLSQVS